MVKQVNYESQMKDHKRKMQKLENIVLEVQNMNVTLENFIDRYECIRIQNLINDALLAIFPFSTPQGRKADLYHSQKMSILYENLFPQEGEEHDAKAKGDIQNLINMMYERARQTMAEDELRQGLAPPKSFREQSETTPRVIDTSRTKTIESNQGERPFIVVDEELMKRCDL